MINGERSQHKCMMKKLILYDVFFVKKYIVDFIIVKGTPWDETFSMLSILTI